MKIIRDLGSSTVIEGKIAWADPEGGAEGPYAPSPHWKITMGHRFP